jgi:hypothetical protein
LVCNGYWEIDVVTRGRYRFELRRWPVEEDRAMVEGIPGEWVRYYDLRDSYGGGRAIPLVTARIEVGGREMVLPISSEDKGVAFEMDLPAGEARLQTWLTDAAGESIGAYYVYATRVPVA